MINTDKIKSYLILKNQRHLRSICRKIGISLMLLLTVAWVNAGFDGSASLTTRIDVSDVVLTKADSLKQVIATAKEDTTRINALNKLSWEFSNINPDTAILLAEKALKLSENIDNKNMIANSYHQIAWSNYIQGNYTKSLDYNFKALEIRKRLDIKKAIAASHSNIGLVYKVQGDYSAALNHTFESLKIERVLGNKDGIATDLLNIGMIYKLRGDYSTAMEHYFQALTINKQVGDKRGIAFCLNNISNVYILRGDYPAALKHLHEALEIDKSLGYKRGMGYRLGNIGVVYSKMGEYPFALKYYFESLEIEKELRNKAGMAADFGNIGSLFIKTGRFTEAEQYLDSALSICNSIGALNIKMQIEELLSNLYDTWALSAVSSSQSAKITEYYKKAYGHFIKYSAAKDSLFNEEKSKEIGRIEQQHEFEMAEIERKKVESEKLKAESEKIKRRDLLQYTAILIGIILFFGLILLFVRLHLPTWVVELSVFMLFLLIFEFTLVLLDPTIDAWTGGAPAYKLLLNAALAGLIFPVHGLCERLLKKKIMERR